MEVLLPSADGGQQQQRGGVPENVLYLIFLLFLSENKCGHVQMEEECQLFSHRLHHFKTYFATEALVKCVSAFLIFL